MASPEGERTENTEQLSVTPRTNFNETAFFYPTIYSNDSNEYVLNFTLPESLTKWKLLMLGHNKELQIGAFQKEIIAQKELMVTANAPRFVRQGDAFDFSAKVVNLTKEEQTVEVFLKLENPMNGEVLNLIGRQPLRSEEHTSELQSRPHLVCRLLLEKKNKQLRTRQKK